MSVAEKKHKNFLSALRLNVGCVVRKDFLEKKL